ncbi:MAG: glycine--tRNA ligase subunit beta [Actinobacteria bacterium]|jgi:glycyl-tRNA synthetase beta chain|nr:MAG: glycine--tRNA ligase subunit beta [Actinomycetota bacterium]
MAGDLLLEIGTEELPWGAVQDGRRQLAENAAELLARERLNHGDIVIYSTPRRLTLLVRELDDRQEDISTEVRGPSHEASYDAEGNPTKAAEGFARSRGLRVEDLEIRKTGKGEFVFAVVREEGKPAVEVLPGMLEELIGSLSFRKSMRWGSGEFRFARPVRWLVALHGNDVIDISLEGLRAGRISRGHRFLSPGKVEIAGTGTYLEALKANCVLADEEERREAILAGTADVVSGRGMRAVPAADTLEEVVDLVEYPHVVVGSFDERFLGLPREVLETAMQEHQRYFPVEDEDGGLAAAFLVVHNGDPAQEEVIRRGNERVLRARLEDASFFYTEDMRLSLEERLQDLKDVVWQAKLGSMYDKCQRLRELCAGICRGARLDPEVEEMAERAALLCKSDLITAMVVEFPSLQGVMGRIYAMEAGEKVGTAAAIEEHYRPRFSGDTRPETTAGTVLSLAEKADNLAGCFGAGLAPTGSEDPYALRRQAQAVMPILVDACMHLDFALVLEEAASRLGFSDPRGVAEEVVEFCRQRWRQMLMSEGFEYDLVAAVMPTAPYDPYDARLRLEAMARARSQGTLQKAYTGFERCYNLSRKMEEARLDEGLLLEDAEKNLYSKLVWAQQPFRDHLDSDEHDAALGMLLELAPDVDRFFETIFVMGDDERLRDNRLALLSEVAGLFLEFADFSQVVTE